MKRLVLAFGLCLLSFSAQAATCSVTSPLAKDATASPQTFNVPYADDGSGSGACEPKVFTNVQDGANVTLGAKADAKSTATDTTPITIMQVLKQISASVQAFVTGLTSGTQKTQIVDGSGNVIASTSNALNVDVTNANANGQATMTNSSPVVIASNQSNVPVVNGASRYQHVAASQTAAVLQSSAGAAGDYLSHCVIYPSTTGAGSVTVFDNTNSAANNVIEFTTGTLSNLAPIAIPVGAISVNGAWKVTTGANETVVCYGKFS